MKNFLEFNKNESTSGQNLQDTAKAMPLLSLLNSVLFWLFRARRGYKSFFIDQLIFTL
jgi:hypothetical protein